MIVVCMMISHGDQIKGRIFRRERQPSFTQNRALRSKTSEKNVVKNRGELWSLRASKTY